MIKNFFIENKVLTISFVVFAILFWFYPKIDLLTASFFYDGKVFFLSQNIVVLSLHRYTQVVTAVCGMTIFLLLIFMVFTKKDLLSGKKAAIFLLITLALGPGLLVNTVFKDNFGRARPAQIKEFGGQKEFTRAFEISNNCEKNCSFTCGHAAAGFWFLSFGFLAKNVWRTRIIYAGSIFGFIVGIGRMAQGGHFLSDVIFSFLFVYLVSKIVYKVMYECD